MGKVRDRESGGREKLRKKGEKPDKKENSVREKKAEEKITQRERRGAEGVERAEVAEKGAGKW